jgi:hypothetical protein
MTMGSIYDEIIGLSIWSSASSRSILLGLTQPLPEISTSNLPCRRVRLENLKLVIQLLIHTICKSSCLQFKTSLKMGGAPRQQAIANTPANTPAYRIPSVIVAFVVFKV